MRIADYLDPVRIEKIVQSVECHPREVLAPRVTKDGLLLQAYFPGRDKVEVRVASSRRLIPMEYQGWDGYYAVLLPYWKLQPHVFVADGREYGDPYAFEGIISAETRSRFGSGICYDLYKHLGAHPVTVDKQSGVHFAVWAPNAVRVSVVGDFNDWDGRRHPMELCEESGIFELFIPLLGEDTRYRYEIKLADGLTYTRPDPCGNYFLENAAMPVVCALGYRWHDKSYMEKRRKKLPGEEATAIYECSLPDTGFVAPGQERSYRSIADALVPYVKERGYTHIQVLPVMEYPDNPYHTSGYYAPSSRLGTPQDFKYFVDRAHKAGLGVILTWTPGQFSADDRFLAAFDGTFLYEHKDPRQGVHPLYGNRLFNYGRPEVRNFLIANAIFWIREYHVDGLHMDGCSTILRLDFGRARGSWVPNIFGGNDNLDGIEFLKHMNSVIHRDYPDVFLSLEEDIDYPMTTGAVEEGGLGFHFKWNLHFTDNMIDFLGRDEQGRQARYDVLTHPMLHNYMDRQMLSLSRGLGFFDAGLFRGKIAGEGSACEALLRAAYTFMVCHPGAKLFAEGEDEGREFADALLGLLRSERALSALDFEEAGFCWINNMDAAHNVISYQRRDDAGNELLIVCNFSDYARPYYAIGAEAGAVYTEILNTDDERFGGTGGRNSGEMTAVSGPADGRNGHLTLSLARLSACVLKRKR